MTCQVVLGLDVVKKQQQGFGRFWGVKCQCVSGNLFKG